MSKKSTPEEVSNKDDVFKCFVHGFLEWRTALVLGDSNCEFGQIWAPTIES